MLITYFPKLLNETTPKCHAKYASGVTYMEERFLFYEYNRHVVFLDNIIIFGSITTEHKHYAPLSSN